MLSDEAAYEIKRRLSLATPGPWLNHTGEFVSQAVTYMAICRVNRPVVNDYQHGKTVSGPRAMEEANKEFIAHAPEDVASLLAERDALRARLADVERERDDLTIRVLADGIGLVTLREQLAEATPIIAAAAVAEVRTPQYSDPVLAWDTEYERDYENPPAYEVREQARAYTAKYGATDAEVQ